MGVTWVMGTNTLNGKAFIATDDGGRVEFDKGDAAYIAASLSQYERDDDTRAFVADEWGGLGDG